MVDQVLIFDYLGLTRQLSNRGASSGKGTEDRRIKSRKVCVLDAEMESISS